MSEGTEAGKGEGERRRGPGRQAGARAGEIVTTPDAVALSANEGLPGGARGRLDEEFPEDLPTLPPAPGRREAALRWALPEEPPAPIPGANRPQRSGPPTWPGRDQPPPRARGSTRPGRMDRPGATLRPTAAITVPEHPSRRRSRIFWLLAVVLLVVASAAVAVALSRGTTGGGEHRSRLSAGEVLFERLMATGSTAQQLTATAVARSCAEAPPGARGRTALLGDLSRAIGLGQSVLQLLNADKAELLGIPGGSLLTSDLSQATTAELTVEQDYQGWLQDLQATGCYSAPTNDIHYRAAGLEAPVAAAADQRLAAEWAVVERAPDVRR